ncbi:hypothetical protein KY306_01110 [Candidatus Woesearchaeota archaeon]|nr:hypothetical protein [Candidatus Woesearchaeota archaeon]
MKIKFALGNLSAEKEVDSGDFILTNRLGGFFYSNLGTRYGGWFVFEGEMFKILEGFGNAVSHFENWFYQINRKGKILEEYYLPFGENSLVYGSSGEIELVLDVRKPFDNRTWGRNYEIFFEEDKTVIKFTKKTDKREDKSNGGTEFEMFVVINAIGEKIDKWVEKNYDLDKKRNSSPVTRHVYQAVKFKPGRYVITAGLDKERVLSRHKYVVENWEVLREKQKKYFETFLEGNLTRFCAQTALDSLINHFDGKSMWAGLPWFFQEWTRDEAISCKALMIEGEFELAKKLLLSHLDCVLEDGRLPNYHREKYRTEYLESADAAGWVFLRLGELIKLGKLDENELKLVKSKLVLVIEKLLTYHTKNKLAMNGVLETWMDTGPKGYQRDGACIEIQTLRLAMYRLAYELTRDKKYQVMEKEMKEEVRQHFWDEEMLVDRVGDLTARPNVFLAAYIYPGLLTKEEWITAFEYVLERIWLEWGGLSTIDFRSKLFANEYSGENNKSYHHGDSWFWVNNLAALMMLCFDRVKFKDYIAKIFTASQNELLWSGAIGCSAELSSAKELRSEGCELQAWSCATFIELIEELSKKN